MNHFSFSLKVLHPGGKYSEIPPHESYNMIAYLIDQGIGTECKCGLNSHRDFYEVLCTHDFDRVLTALKMENVYENIIRIVSFICIKTKFDTFSYPLNIETLKMIYNDMRKRIEMIQLPIIKRVEQEFSRINDKLNLFAEKIDGIIDRLDNID